MKKQGIGEIIKPLKVDISLLRTVKNYANQKNFTPAWIYRLGERKEIKIIEIDGVKFVQLKKEQKQIKETNLCVKCSKEFTDNIKPYKCDNCGCEYEDIELLEGVVIGIKPKNKEV